MGQHGFGMITAEQAADIRRRNDAADRWLRRHRSGRGGWVSYDPKDPAIPPFVRNQPSNEERGELEVFEFVRDRPDRYFAYYSDDWRELRAWPGQKLGDITYRGPIYRTGFGGAAQMRHIRARAITGDDYAGTCAVSGGTYCRLKKMKRR